MSDKEQAQRLADAQASAVPLHEQLASVPHDARLVIDDADGKGTRYIPIGRMAHEAAALLRRWPDGEPVGWWHPSTPPGYYASTFHLGKAPPEPLTEAEAIAKGWTPVYTAPPAAPSPCSLGCVESCKAREHGCASECPALPWQPPAERIAALEAENANLRTVMVAAAEEIHRHWDAHCDAEGYGPANLMRRLEEGIAAQYGYTAGAFEEQRARIAALEAALEQARVAFSALMAHHDEDIGMDDHHDDDSVGWYGDSTPMPMTFGELRRARAALRKIEEVRRG